MTRGSLSFFEASNSLRASFESLSFQGVPDSLEEDIQKEEEKKGLIMSSSSSDYNKKGSSKSKGFQHKLYWDLQNHHHSPAVEDKMNGSIGSPSLHTNHNQPITTSKGLLLSSSSLHHHQLGLLEPYVIKF